MTTFATMTAVTGAIFTAAQFNTNVRNSLLHVKNIVSDNASGGLEYAEKTELTISSGAVTATQNLHTIDTQSDAATDDLITITAGTDMDEGFVLKLLNANSARVTTLLDADGNLDLDGNDVTLSHENHTELIKLASGNWGLGHPPPGGGGLVHIATAASGSGEFNLGSLTTTSYDVLEVEISGGESDTDDVEILMQLNGVTGSVYRTALEGKSDAGAAFERNGMTEAHAFICGANGSGDSVGNAADEGCHALVRIYNDFSANECFYTVSSVWESSYSQTFAAYGGGKADLGSDTSITAIKIKPQSGNIDSGNIYLKGRAKS